MNYHNLIAIDLAKNVFQVCIMSTSNRVLMNKSFNRKGLTEFMLKQPVSVVAMEACYSSHYWGRLFESFGHQVKLLPAQHVKPFVRGNKNDHNDALAIAEASQRPRIKAVPIKTVAQQDIQSLHRLRERCVSQRTSLSNQTRGLLSEYGIVFPTGFKSFKQTLAVLIDPSNTQLTEPLKQQLRYVADEFDRMSARLTELNQVLAQIAQTNPHCQRLMSIPGIGYINATALYSAIGNGSQFNNARELSVWLGITPKQYASGNKQVMAGITKRGNRYLRKQLIHGARALMRYCKKRDDQLSQWLQAIEQRRGKNKACVALANKIARLCWTLLQTNQMYRSR